MGLKFFPVVGRVERRIHFNHHESITNGGHARGGLDRFRHVLIIISSSTSRGSKEVVANKCMQEDGLVTLLSYCGMCSFSWSLWL